MDGVIIRVDSLVAGDSTYRSGAFARLLQVLGVSELPFSAAEVTQDGGGSKNFTVKGAARLFDQEVEGVSLYLAYGAAGGSPEFQFQFRATLPSLSLSTLRARGILPVGPLSDVVQLLSAEFEGVGLVFDSEGERVYFGLLSSDLRLNILASAGLALEAIGFEFLRSYAERTVKLIAHATIRMGATAVETVIEVPLATATAAGAWVLSTRGTVPLTSGLQDLIDFLEGLPPVKALSPSSSFSDSFPRQIHDIPAFFLDEVKVIFDPLRAQLQFLTFRLISARPLKVAGDSFVLGQVGLRMNVTPPAGAQGISLTLFGTMSVSDEVELDVSVLLPENFQQKDWVFMMSGGADLKGFNDIELLPVNTPVGELTLPPDFLTLESLRLNLFEISFNPLAARLSSFALDFATRASLELIHGLKFENPSLSLSITDPFNQTGPQGRKLAGAFGGTVAVGDVSFGLSAAKQDAGWSFEGKTESNSVPVGKFIDSLGAKFGLTMPDFVSGISLKNLSLNFSTTTDAAANKSQSLRFTCEGGLPVDDKEVDLLLTADVRKGADSVYTYDLGGTLTVGPAPGQAGDRLQFSTYYSKRPADNFFVAAYTHTDPRQNFSVKDLLARVSTGVAEYVPAGLQIDLKDVLFAFSKDAGGTKFVFGLDLGTALDLSSLPLVGQKFPADLTIGVDDIQFLIALSALSRAEVDALNALLPAGVTKLPAPAQGATTSGTQTTGTQTPGTQTTDNSATPPALPSGLTVSAKMKFGATPSTLSLPVAGGAQQQQAGAGSAPVTTQPANVPTTSAGNAKWFTLQKTFGPVYFDKVGVQYQDGVLSFLLNASLSAVGLTLSLDGLSVGSPVNGFRPQFDLRGLGIQYKGGGEVEIGGALLRARRERKDKPGEFYDEYDGAAFVKAGQLKLSALGSYAELDGHPSLFVYAVLDYPIGGPSFFFVTGLAAGFGYNRLLVVPPIEQVAQFPLVADAVSGAAMPANVSDKVASLQRFVPPSAGDYFLAVGIKFNSFKLIDSFALLTVSFGTQFEVNLLGLSTLIVPTPIPGETVTPLAEVQLAVRATFNPSQGFLGVAAQLTSNSFILSRDCRLTGGFAFYSWFSGAHKGDFVLTLGGYHPDYKVPAHYPVVPRLGFNWRVDSKLTVKGGMYYALTAAALMAGGSLQATWDSGDLKAHFTAGADFIIYWKPYRYDAKVYVDIGVSYTYNLFGTHHLNVDVGADLHIWGPEFAGTAHIKLSVISFDISFGAASGRKLEPIDWGAFSESFLPKAKKGGLDICTVSVADGLLSVPPPSADAKKDSAIDWYINPKGFLLVTNSVIPSKEAYKRDEAADTGKANKTVGVAPMALTSAHFSSRHTVSFSRRNSQGVFEAADADFDLKPVLKDVPVALWGESLTPSLNGPAFVKDALAGFEVSARAAPTPGATADIERSALQYETEKVADAFAWESFRAFTPKTYGGADEEAEEAARLADIVATINDGGALARARLLKALGVTDAVDLAGYAADGFIIPPQVEAA